MEKDFESKDAFIESLIENSAVATFVIDSGHKVLYWNKACEELTGLKKEALIGTGDHWKAFYRQPHPTVADLIIDNKTNEIDKSYEVFSKSKLISEGLHAEGWYPKLGGKTRYLVFDAAPIKGADGKLVASIETLQDLTELKLQEMIIASLIENSAVATIVIDSRHDVKYWNKACEKLTGMKKEDLIGTRDHWKAFYSEPHPCIADLVVDKNFNEIDKYYKVYSRSALVADGIHAEGWYPDLGGKERYIVFDAAPIKGVEGKLIGAVETIQDITDLKQAEEDIQKVSKR